MKNNSLILLQALLLLSSFSMAQTNYNAGAGSGTGGSYNVFIGPYAGRITSSAYNSFLGAYSGYNNTSGGYNSFLGYQAGINNTTGSSNSFVGTNAGYGNKTGNFNTFMGRTAGFSNTSGTYNSFVGSYAGLSNTSGGYNSFLGYQAGYSNTTGGYNSFMGTQSGFGNTTGSSNSFVGQSAGYVNTTGNRNSFVGSYAGNNNTTAHENSFMGSYAGFYNTTGNSNSFLGYAAGINNTTGSGNLAVGFATNMSVGNLVNAGAIGFRTYVSRSNSLILGSISGVNGATAYTNIGIGTTAPAYRLHVNGMAAKPGSNVWIVASDKRLKQDIAAFTDGLEVLKQIKPVRYRYNGKADMPIEQEYVGVIAQEVQQIAPYMIGKFTYQDTTGKQEEYLDYDATALTYILVNAVKAQQEQLVEKDAQITQIQQELAQIKELLLKQLPVSNQSQARLWQNTPNPYQESTVIKYELPSATGSAAIKIYSVTGQELYSFDLSGETTGEVIISAGTLSAGTYVYKLFIDGKSIDSKKLVLNR